tara:strand:+ start:660 stop:857 length:198 start_codon:yes stop_codon:yes gene_type:complete
MDLCISLETGLPTLRTDTWDGCLLQLKATVYAEVRLNVNGYDYEILEIDSEYKETDIVDLDNLGN